MKHIFLSLLCAFVCISTTKAQQTFTKINPYSYLDGNGKPISFFTPFGTFQKVDSTYMVVGCVYAGTHIGKWASFGVEISSSGTFIKNNDYGTGCVYYLLTDTNYTKQFASKGWDFDTAKIGNTTWSLHLTNDNDATTYIQLVKNNGASVLLDTIGRTFYTYSPYLTFANAPLIASLSDDNLLIVYTNREEQLEVVKYNTQLNEVLYRFTVTKDLLALYNNVLRYDAHASGHICMIKTLDSGYLLTAKVNRLEYDWQNSMLLMKFDSLGNFSWPFATGEQEIQSVPHRVYPNPTTEQVIFELTEQGEYELKVTDVSGKVILETSAQNSKKITTIDWNKGVYFYTLSNKDKVAKGKILKF